MEIDSSVVFMEDQDSVNPKEMDEQLKGFETLLDLLESPHSHSVSEEDIELLNEIYMKLSHLPDFSSFQMEHKS